MRSLFHTREIRPKFYTYQSLLAKMLFSFALFIQLGKSVASVKTIGTKFIMSFGIWMSVIEFKTNEQTNDQQQQW